MADRRHQCQTQVLARNQVLVDTGVTEKMETSCSQVSINSNVLRVAEEKKALSTRYWSAAGDYELYS